MDSKTPEPPILRKAKWMMSVGGVLLLLFTQMNTQGRVTGTSFGDRMAPVQYLMLGAFIVGSLLLAIGGIIYLGLQRPASSTDGPVKTFFKGYWKLFKIPLVIGFVVAVVCSIMAIINR